MHRRSFFRSGLLLLPALGSAGSWLQACSKEVDDQVGKGKRVIIVGAGIAGLAAATKLKAHGFEVVVLEAKSVAGGRIRTNRAAPILWDEGASWIHGPNGNPITPLAQQASATTFATNDELVQVFNAAGQAYPETVLDLAETQYNNALATVRNAGAGNSSFASVFQQRFPSQWNDPLWKYFLSAYTEFNTGGSLEQLSSKHFEDDEAFNGSDLFITDGFDKVTNLLAQGLDIRYNSPVASVNATTNSQEVMLKNGQSLSADYVVVAVPLGVLKAGHIQFNPGLPPEKRAAMDRLQMGVVNKFVLQFPTMFWNNHLHYMGYTPDTRGKFNYFLNCRKFSAANVLMTFAYGPYAAATEQLSDAQCQAEVMSHLRAIYGNNIPAPTNFGRTRWGQDAHTLGSYSFAAVGSTPADFATLAAPVGNRLFFAGEHTSEEYWGTVHGAYLSGVREAERVVRGG